MHARLQDHNGTLDYDELKEGMRRVGLRMSEREMAAVGQHFHAHICVHVCMHMYM